VVHIEGAGAEATLARLVPVDLRERFLAQGRTVRTLLGHMAVSITRVGPMEFEVMAMRSMARTLVHELAEAAIGVEARG
jgi:heterotetrameric sarcosine oxidase gamma subunit